ncbi:MAG: hypothetical protein RBS80_29825, partial [Thermoguttaceae bacterium]|nr:hypothetical protein [Thermoguttaceae bacterium]
MTVFTRKWCLSVSVLTIVISLVGATALAATPSGGPLKPGEFNPEHESVDMFQAIESGQIEVKLIPRDATECNVLIENKSDQPLNVKLPSAFVGMPVLAQFGG